MIAPAMPREATATIRGYIYQFDATIRKLLTLDAASTLTIEGVEDFDRNVGLTSEYSQVKYYAAQKLTDSVLRDAILPMLKGFLLMHTTQRTTKTYVLYGYFKEAAAGRLSLALDDMKRILVKTSFEIIGGKKKALFTNLQTELMASDVDLTDFASRITIFLAEEYQLHKALAIQELQAALNVGKAEAESYSYPSALTAVSEVAAVSQPSARIMTRQQFLSAIRPSAAIYNEWTLREEGDTAYGKKMRAKYFESLNVEALERFFVITGSAGFTSSDLDGIVRHIVEKWSTYNSRSKPDNERFAPYLYFPGISENDLIAMKQSLANDGIEITDGYTFFGSKLDLYSLQQPQTRHRRIAARFLGNQEQMVTILKEMKKNKLIIQLYVNEQEPMPLGYRQIAIPVTSANMIKAIL